MGSKVGRSYFVFLFFLQARTQRSKKKNATFSSFVHFVICDKSCCSDLPSQLFFLLLCIWENRRFLQRSPATVPGDCVGGNMKGRNLNVSDTASTEPRRIPLRTLGRLAAGMRTSFRGAWSITDKYYRNKPAGCEKTLISCQQLSKAAASFLHNVLISIVVYRR